MSNFANNSGVNGSSNSLNIRINGINCTSNIENNVKVHNDHIENIEISAGTDFSLQAFLSSIASDEKILTTFAKAAMSQGPIAVVSFAKAIAEAKHILRAERQKDFEDEQARRIARAKADLEIERMRSTYQKVEKTMDAVVKGGKKKEYPNIDPEENTI